MMSYSNLKYMCSNAIGQAARILYQEGRDGNNEKTTVQEAEAIVIKDKEFMLCDISKKIPSWFTHLYFNYKCKTNGCPQLYDAGDHQVVMFVQSVSDCEPIERPIGKANYLEDTDFEQILPMFEETISNYRNSTLNVTEDALTNCLNQNLFARTNMTNVAHVISQNTCENFNKVENIIPFIILGFVLFILIFQVATYSYKAFQRRR